ncbi:MULTISPECIES: hypothetical protein [Brevibacillus]|uniref:hypothetical protein n=1 Tax=Brevibacillus TaxID=55080 RepID=UPI000D112D75|nr:MULTISPECIES: hypothetical protein [Brevibacillus]PSJ69043.1 hypothetical protein C7J99_11855 [Brevibacillus brevis]RED33027.1 hypothetical protein DES34_103344 [Brevibacillus brevis]TQK73953.1 hypothetical protein FB479_102593 [Brevibacillus sp. AG162]VEF90697.1 Uncharacterised protein [Brevibacillus brevis]GEC90382.1 hypothetical protein BBR01nite_27130 [Brevibacillus brevis]
MLSLNHPTMDAISLAKYQLIQAIVQHRTKPYLPVWGELFTALREIRKAGQHSQKNLHVYSIEPTGDLWYLYRENVFSVDLPGMGITISLTQEQFIDALLKGSFQPTLPITEPS